MTTTVCFTRSTARVFVSRIRMIRANRRAWVSGLVLGLGVSAGQAGAAQPAPDQGEAGTNPAQPAEISSPQADPAASPGTAPAPAVSPGEGGAAPSSGSTSTAPPTAAPAPVEAAAPVASPAPAQTTTPPPAPSESSASDDVWVESDEDVSSGSPAPLNRSKRGTLVGLRLGVEFPLGDIRLESETTYYDGGWEQQSAGTDVNYRLVAGLDIAGRAGRVLALGAYVRATLIPEGDPAVGGSLGGLALFDMTPSAKAGPWAAMGLGYQWLMFTDGAFKGVEIVPQFGVDFAVGSTAALGPYADLTLARYTTTTCPDCSGWNKWASVGVRARL